MDTSSKSSVPSVKEKIVYNVWLSGEKPTIDEPALTLHDEKAVHFFIQALVRGPIPYFSDGPFAISAHTVLCGAQLEVARGLYRVRVKSDGSVLCEKLHECGMLNEACSDGVIITLLQDACKAAKAA